MNLKIWSIQDDFYFNSLAYFALFLLFFQAAKKVADDDWNNFLKFLKFWNFRNFLLLSGSQKSSWWRLGQLVFRTRQRVTANFPGTICHERSFDWFTSKNGRNHYKTGKNVAASSTGMKFFGGKLGNKGKTKKFNQIS